MFLDTPNISNSIRVQGKGYNLPSTPLAVAVSPEEVKTNALGWRNLEIATRALHRDGIVILQDVIDHSKLGFLNDKMLGDAELLQKADYPIPYNFHKGNVQQNPPITKTYFDPEIFLNPLVVQVTSSILGPRPRLSFVSGNTALAHSPTRPPQSQPIHSDADFEHPNCPFAFVINIGLVEMNPKNGSTEFWLGTQNEGFESQEEVRGERTRIRTDVLDSRRKVRAPVQPTVATGSVIIRDMRLWHGGKPNYSDGNRIMLAMIHFAPWYRNPMTFTAAEELKPLIDKYKDTLQVQVKFAVEEEVLKQYLRNCQDHKYDFGQQDEIDDGVFVGILFEEHNGMLEG